MISLASVATPIFANECGEEAKVSTYVNSVDGFLPASTPKIQYQIEAATDATGSWHADAEPGTVLTVLKAHSPSLMQNWLTMMLLIKK